MAQISKQMIILLETRAEWIRSGMWQPGMWHFENKIVFSYGWSNIGSYPFFPKSAGLKMLYLSKYTLQSLKIKYSIGNLGMKMPFFTKSETNIFNSFQ